MIKKELIVVTGDPGIGKSWTAFLVTSRLLKDLLSAFAIIFLFQNEEFFLNSTLSENFDII